MPAAGAAPAGGIVETARAKVNLALHVTGRRDDGYHLIETLAVFPPIGDRLTAVPADGGFSLAVSGPEAAALAGLPAADNLVVRAAKALAAAIGATGGVSFGLEKHLPVAAGIGGGSADAGAALRALTRLWGIGPQKMDVVGVALGLGADVPMCLFSTPSLAYGIGEVLRPAPPLPSLGIVLANPRVPLATAPVFAALAGRFGSSLPDAPATADRGVWLDWLAGCRNDLQAPAIALAPVIADVLALLRTLPGARLARMSGSGATCFALFDDPEAAQHAAAVLRSAHPGWWIASGPVVS